MALTQLSYLPLLLSWTSSQIACQHWTLCIVNISHQKKLSLRQNLVTDAAVLHLSSWNTLPSLKVNIFYLIAAFKWRI